MLLSATCLQHVCNMQLYLDLASDSNNMQLQRHTLRLHNGFNGCWADAVHHAIILLKEKNERIQQNPTESDQKSLSSFCIQELMVLILVSETYCIILSCFEYGANSLPLPFASPGLVSCHDEVAHSSSLAVVPPARDLQETDHKYDLKQVKRHLVFSSNLNLKQDKFQWLRLLYYLYSSILSSQRRYCWSALEKASRRCSAATHRSYPSE